MSTSRFYPHTNYSTNFYASIQTMPTQTSPLVRTDHGEGFRVRAQMFFGTLAHTDDVVECDMVLANIQEVVGVGLKQALVVKEKYPHSDGHHIHFLVDRRPQKKEIPWGKFWSVFPINGADFQLIRTQKDWNTLVVYCSKDPIGPILGNFDVSYVKGDYIKLARKRKFKEAEEAFAAVHPKEYTINLSRVRQNLRRIGKVYKPVPVKPWSSFIPSESLMNAMALPKATALIGETGLGKTQFVLSWAKENNLTIAVIRHWDQLKSYDLDRVDVLLFDDLACAHWDVNYQKMLLDHELESVVHCRYTHVNIPAGMKKVFTANPEKPPLSVGDAAIDRRIKVVKIRAKLYQ